MSDSFRQLSRRSLGGISVLRNKPGSPNISREGELPVNDDETEKRLRAQQRIIDHQERHLNSPSTPSHRRLQQGQAAHGLTIQEVTDHYKDCIRLSTENKITKKNAFGLHLIDYMADVLKSNENETNFQLASCTIDASAKIYSYRVDCVHSDVLNVASGMAIKGKKNRDNKENEDVLSGSDGLPTRKKSKKTKKKAVTIETNLDNITLGCIEHRDEPDALFKKMTSSLDECGVGGLLCNNLCMADDGGELLMDPALFPAALDCLRSLNRDQVPCDFKLYNDCLLEVMESNPPICETLKDFEFLSDISVSFAFQSKNKSPVQNDDYAFDANDVGERGEQMDDDVFPTNSPGNFDGDTNNDATNFFEEVGNAPGYEQKERCPETKARSLDTVAEMSTFLADNPSEYSYFDRTLLSLWGGPNHWKLPNPTKKNYETGKGEAPKHKRAAGKKEHATIDFTVEDEELDRSAFVSLSKLTLSRWDSSRLTLPKDSHFTPRMFAACFLKPDLIVRLKKSQPLDTDRGDDPYNYENRQDQNNFCPSAEDHGDSGNDADTDNLQDHDRAFSPGPTQEEVPDSQHTPLIFSGENLIQQPHRVEKFRIQYTRKAKKIDSRKVIHAMWKILTRTESEQQVPEGAKMDGEIMFGQVIKELPKYLPESTIQDLSVPYSLVSFLHVVNERNLCLEENKTFSDFKITQN